MGFSCAWGRGTQERWPPRGGRVGEEARPIPALRPPEGATSPVAQPPRPSACLPSGPGPSFLLLERTTHVLSRIMSSSPSIRSFLYREAATCPRTASHEQQVSTTLRLPRCRTWSLLLRPEWLEVIPNRPLNVEGPSTSQHRSSRPHKLAVVPAEPLDTCTQLPPTVSLFCVVVCAPQAFEGGSLS